MNPLIITGIAACIIAALFLLLAKIGKWSDDAMNKIMDNKPRKWQERTDLTGTKYLVPEDFEPKIERTEK